MTRKIIYFSVLLIFFSAMLLGVGYACTQWPLYLGVSEKIHILDEMSTLQDDPSISLIYESTSEKYSNAELEKSFYYGYKHMYEREGVLFFGTADFMDEERLSELADELFANKHGDEIKYLEKVVFYASYSDGSAGDHSSAYYAYQLPVSFHHFFPDESEFVAAYKKSSINIYGAFENTAVEDLSYVISHEYGHHYTSYYFGLNGDKTDTETEYYSLRAAADENIQVEREYYEDYLEDHKWYLMEIAAEDYVYLMGSPNAKRVVKFYDNFQKYQMYLNGQETVLSLHKDLVVMCANAYPHENVSLPMPGAVAGLADYFYSFIDASSPFTEDIDYSSIGTLNLSMENVYLRMHNFTWDQPYTDPDITYTLIGYDMDDKIMVAVKTTSGGQEGLARLGCYASWPTPANNPKEDLYKYYYETGEQMKFRVSITFPDGLVVLSDPVVFTMGVMEE